MPWLGNSKGIFKLNDSDSYCGSFISVDDASFILGVDSSKLSNLPQKIIDSERYLSELDLHKAWGNGAISGSPPQKIGNATRSLDELIIMKLLEVNLVGCSVEPQVQFGRKRADIKFSYEGKVFFIEFVGPAHFIQYYQSTVVSPLIRKEEIEDHFGHECIIWPYWIQRCSKNIKAIVSSVRDGMASVWSTKAFFGDFIFPDSANLIITISDRFGAVKENGLGYMYGDKHTDKPIHPIVNQIINGSQSKDKLIPKGNVYHDSFWLPDELYVK